MDAYGGPGLVGYCAYRRRYTEDYQHLRWTVDQPDDVVDQVKTESTKKVRGQNRVAQQKEGSSDGGRDEISVLERQTCRKAGCACRQQCIEESNPT